MNFIQDLIVLAPPFVFALTVHEYAHGYVAHHLGDPTAANLGRLTLNPMKHLDPMGVICFFLIHIGWAKPVPVDSRYFKNPKKDLLWVALAGPGVNLLMAIISGLLIKFLLLSAGILPGIVVIPLAKMLAASVWINIMLAVFNLLPIYPLDGGQILQSLLWFVIGRSASLRITAGIGVGVPASSDWWK